LTQSLSEFPGGSDWLLDGATGFLKKQRIAGADGDRRASRRDFVEGRHGHGRRGRMPQIGAYRGRNEGGAGVFMANATQVAIASR